MYPRDIQPISIHCLGTKIIYRKSTGHLHHVCLTLSTFPRCLLFIHRKMHDIVGYLHFIQISSTMQVLLLVHQNAPLNICPKTQNELNSRFCKMVLQVPLACLNTMSRGSMPGTSVELLENSIQTLLCSSFCLLVCHPMYQLLASRYD